MERWGAVNQTKPANFAQNSMRFVLKYSAILTDHKNRRNPTIEIRNLLNERVKYGQDVSMVTHI